MTQINCPDHGITKCTNTISKSGVRGVVCSECFAKFKGKWEEEKSETTSLEIVVKNIIKVSSNEIYAGKHWRSRNKLKEQYLWLTINFKNLPRIQGKVDIDFQFFFASKIIDSSNCSYMGKILEDCLVKYGVLEGDSIKFVRKVSYEAKKTKEECDYCVITITNN